MVLTACNNMYDNSATVNRHTPRKGYFPCPGLPGDKDSRCRR